MLTEISIHNTIKVKSENLPGMPKKRNGFILIIMMDKSTSQKTFKNILLMVANTCKKGLWQKLLISAKHRQMS